VADATRAVIGPDDPAAAVRVIIVVRRIEAPVKVVPVKVLVVREPAMAKAAAVQNMCAPEAAAMKRRTTAMEASAVETSATMAAMPAADLGRDPAGSVFRRGRTARIDQRKRLGALARCGRQREHRGSRKAQATDKAAPGISNLHHCVRSPRMLATRSRAMKWPAFGMFICDRSQNQIRDDDLNAP